jgi:hypothetical protein
MRKHRRKSFHGNMHTPPRPEREKTSTPICTKCRTAKPLTEYPINITCTNGHGTICRPCMNISTKEARRKRRERADEFRAF